MEIDRAVESLGQGGVLGCLVCFRGPHLKPQLIKVNFCILNMCMFPCIERYNIVVHSECGEIIGTKNVFLLQLPTSHFKITLTNTPDVSIG